MAHKIILSADSTCDIGPALQQRYDVHFFNYHIQVGDKSYIDKLEISPGELFSAWREQGVLPKTAAITPEDYADHFRAWVNDGYDVVHICLGSGISSAYSNCCLAAEDIGHVYPVDSASLSSGSGHLVVQAGKMIGQGMAAADIQAALVRLSGQVSASFVIDTLEFLKAGGRCSALAAFGANLLNLKPCIRVLADDHGKMTTGKKYRGNIEKVLPEYVRDQLWGRTDIDPALCFITHALALPQDVEMVRGEIAKYYAFDEVVETDACGTIASHCGPRTLGILFMTK